MRAVLMFNPAAGSAKGHLEQIRKAFEGKLELTCCETSRDMDIAARVRELITTRPDVVIASGGDGTVSAVAEGLMSSGVPLGIIPSGTANSLATGLGIPAAVDDACRVILSGQRRWIDSARCNGRQMLLLASVGIAAETIGETSADDKQRFGLLAYIMTGIKKLTELEPFELELETAEEIIRCRAIAATVANLAPSHTLHAQGPAALACDDGLLDVTVIAASSLLEAVATGYHLFVRAASQLPAERDNVGYFRCAKVRIRTSPAKPLLIDGELAGESPALVECVPRSLAIFVPEVVEAQAGSEKKLEGLPDLEVTPKRLA